ncbi:hypothetical protein lerEdw1_010943 [Lerista edwardsae]|nr:hypothetical protein lerEdw1_010943 [Lerista edwardsae]
MMTEEDLYRELVESDDEAVGLSEGEQALSSSQRAPYNDVVLASLDNPTPESFPDFSVGTSKSQELVKSDDAAIGLSVGEQAFFSSQRAPYNDVVLASLAPKFQFPDFSWETRSKLQVRDPEDSEKKKVPSPDSSVLSMRDKILESYESLEARYQQMEGMLLSFLHGQQKIQDHLEQLLARLDREASLDHLEQRLDRLDARMLAIQGFSISKPDLIVRLEQGEEPWVLGPEDLDEMQTSDDSSGERVEETSSQKHLFVVVPDL